MGRKQALLLGTLILAGCGGSGSHNAPPVAWQTVHVGAARFQVPKGWAVATGRTGAKASKNQELVQVDTFPLARAYSPKLFTRVESELRVRMAAVAAKTGGSLQGHSVVEAGGIKSHSYVVKVGQRTDTYTFVLRDMREYQLLCSADDAVCTHLIASFVVA